MYADPRYSIPIDFRRFPWPNVLGLVDVPCKGKKFSYFSSDGSSKSRIDCILVSNNNVNWWGVIGQQIGDRDISNHFSILLVVNKKDCFKIRILLVFLRNNGRR